jgi:dihydrofolate reductase
MPTRISIVVAAAENGVIGCHGRLPWHQSSDLKRFRALTLGKPVIMGRKTFEGLPKALDGRDNIVVTRDPGWFADGAIPAPSLDAAIAIATEYADLRGVDEIMVIGGAAVYRAALPSADRIYLTRIHASPAGDAVFPDPDPAGWREISREALPRGPRDDYAAAICVFERTSAPKLAPADDRSTPGP